MTPRELIEGIGPVWVMLMVAGAMSIAFISFSMFQHPACSLECLDNKTYIVKSFLPADFLGGIFSSAYDLGQPEECLQRCVI